MAKVRFAVIGTSVITEQFLEAAVLNKCFELVAVYSRTEETADKFAKKYKARLTFTSLESLASCEEVDAVYIASPNAFHAKQAITLMQHKKHVLCEKPLASNHREVEAMIETAKQNGVTFSEAMIPTTLPNFKIVKKHLHKIGTIRRYFASFCQYSSRYDAYKQGVVLNAFKRELSNGALVDIGVYTIAPLIALFGAPNNVNAHGFMLESGVDAEGTMLLRYDNLHATVMYSKVTNSQLPLEIQGEEGTIIVNRVRSFDEVKFVNRSGEIEVLSVEQRHLMSYELDEFIAAILNGKQETESNPWQQSQQVIKVLDEARKQIGLVYDADAFK